MYKNHRYKNTLVHSRHKAETILLAIARIVVGCVFVFSGFVKSIDPLGSTYKFDDYFRAFGHGFEWLTQVSFPLAIALSTLELVIGLSLLLKVHLRVIAWITFLFMLVMTPLTLYIAHYNPVTDCGCFGDALVITNWQTFFKNVVLLALSIVILAFNWRYHALLFVRGQHAALALFVSLGIGLSVYSYRHLPMIDFLPYKVGVNIPEAMNLPADAKGDEYLTTFIYEKNGVKKEFTLENYPKGDSTWTFVDQKSVLISEGEKPKIHDFSIVDSRYEDITPDVLEYTGHTYLLVMYDLAGASEEGAREAEEIYRKALTRNHRFYALTASSDAAIKAFAEKTGVTFPFYKTDPTTLKTIIRANPGLVLIKNGTIIGKWNWRDFN